jgi:hypothetical protein
MPKITVKPQPFGAPVKFRLFIDVGVDHCEDDTAIGFRYCLFGDPITTEVIVGKVSMHTFNMLPH